MPCTHLQLLCKTGSPGLKRSQAALLVLPSNLEEGLAFLLVPSSQPPGPSWPATPAHPWERCAQRPAQPPPPIPGRWEHCRIRYQMLPRWRLDDSPGLMPSGGSTQVPGEVSGLRLRLGTGPAPTPVPHWCSPHLLLHQSCHPPQTVAPPPNPQDKIPPLW